MKTTSFFLAPLLFAAACSENAADDNAATGGFQIRPTGTPITFSSTGGFQIRPSEIPSPEIRPSEIRPSSMPDLTTANLNAMTVYAHYTGTEAFSQVLAGTTPNFMFAQAVTKAGGAWSYSPLKYWPLQDDNGNPGKVSFFAVSPAPNENANGIKLNTANGSGAYTGYPAFTVTPPAAAAQQADFCVASAIDRTQASDGGKAPLTFDHAMAKVIFAAKYVAADDQFSYPPLYVDGERGLGDDGYIRVEKIELGNVHGSGTLTFNGTSFSWTGQQNPASYTLAAATGELVNAGVFAAGRNGVDYAVSTLAGALMLVPQESVAPNVNLTATFCDGCSSAGTITYNYNNIPLQNSDWQAGKSTTYDFNIKIPEEDLLCWGFKYTGQARTFVAPKAGTYTLEVWGASNYTLDPNFKPPNDIGKGGYSHGKVSLAAGDTLKIYVGGSPASQKAAGYNGGGNAESTAGSTNYPAQGGGGATDMRIKGATLYHRLIVAGGAGGNVQGGYIGGAGGGLSGVDGQAQTNGGQGRGGTQTAGGAAGNYVQNGSAGNPGTFGVGGSNTDGRSGAGGGGWYGGGTGGSGWAYVCSGGGGSGWVFTETAFNAWKTGNPTDADKYQVPTAYYLTYATTVAGTESMPDYANPTGGAMTGNTGHGYARITLLK
jgi:hypothetical protein